jgi:hypothetical protein
LAWLVSGDEPRSLTGNCIDGGSCCARILRARRRGSIAGVRPLIEPTGTPKVVVVASAYGSGIPRPSRRSRI